jgi:hypothetical protein
VTGAPGVDMEARRRTCDDVDTGRFLFTCSADDGVETDNDDDELDDDDTIGMLDAFPALPVVVLFDAVDASDVRPSSCCFVGDDVLTVEGNSLSIGRDNSVD